MKEPEFRIEDSHLMEGLWGGMEELSALMSVMDEDDHCPYCSCHAFLHAPHSERVDGEPVLISIACLECAIQRNVPIASCIVSPENVIKNTPAGRLQESKTLAPDDPRNLMGATMILAMLTGRPYSPLIGEGA